MEGSGPLVSGSIHKEGTSMSKKLFWFASALLMTLACLVGPAKPAAACPLNWCNAAKRAACFTECGGTLQCDVTTCTADCICP